MSETVDYLTDFGRYKFQPEMLGPDSGQDTGQWKQLAPKKFHQIVNRFAYSNWKDYQHGDLTRHVVEKFQRKYGNRFGGYRVTIDNYVPTLVEIWVGKTETTGMLFKLSHGGAA
jgi:hypothetical protein